LVDDILSSLTCPGLIIRTNVWKTLKDPTSGVYWHLETDIVLNFGVHRICILCDGQAFHGRTSYFCGDTVDRDEKKAKILSLYNPFVFRYSDTEIYNHEAVSHLNAVIAALEKGDLVAPYRNWMSQPLHTLDAR
jgi:hypothetical protein